MGTSHGLAGGRLSLFAGTPASSSGTAPTFWFRGDISQTLRLNGSWKHRDENSGALDASLPASQLALLTSPVLSLLYGRRSGPDPKAGWGPPHPPPPAPCLQNRKDAEPGVFPPESDAATLLCPADSHVPVQTELENLLLYSRNFAYLLQSGTSFSGDLKLRESWEHLLLEN